MAGKANWPTGAELGAYLQTLGVETPPGSPSLTDRMEAEVQRWEKATEGVAQEWIKDVAAKGGDGPKLLDAAKALLKQYDK